jgi:dihydroxyacetone kinase-like protein
MNAASLKGVIVSISTLMNKNKDFLVELDQQNGDGDLGISMAAGFKAVEGFLAPAEEKDLGKLLMKCSGVFNEAAPSSLGTILSFGFMGMAKALKGKEEAGVSEAALAMEAGLNNIMEKAKSKPGEKTILDAIAPAVELLKKSDPNDSIAVIYAAAAKAAAEGSEATRAMRSVHGRAAYTAIRASVFLTGDPW